MNVIFVLIPVSLVLLGIGIATFFWAVRNGQFDDLQTPGWQVLVDDAEECRQRRTAVEQDAEDSAAQ